MAYEFKGQTSARTEPEARPPRPSRRRARPGRQRPSLLQALAGVTGLVFLLAGVGGFIPGVTSNYDELSLLGTDSNAELLGLFRVSVLHNIVHLLLAIGLVAATRARWSSLYLIGGGLVYALVAVYGFVVDMTSDANFLPLNDADNYLHVGLAAGMILMGLVGTAVSRRTAPA